MNILNQIVLDKRTQVKRDKELFSVPYLENSLYFNSPCVSLTHYILNPSKSGIITEIKKASPALGLINSTINIEELSIGYMQAGASALSVLTDKKFFGGSNEDLTEARKFNYCPILRKDFIIDEYQIIEAKSIGADCILLIAAILTKEEVKRFSELAKSLGLQIIFEVHQVEELDKINSLIDVVGVNNRNLETMKIDIINSFNMIDKIPSQFIKISESGLETPEQLVELNNVGYHGFLIGSVFMKYPSPHIQCVDFINKYKSLRNIDNGN
jgi:indole-3-glycerol phosphate synthase